MVPAARQSPLWIDALKHPVRSFNTVRHLQPIQIVNRAVRVVRPLAAPPRVDRRLVLRPRSAVRPTTIVRDVFDGRSFCFLNRRIPFGGADRWAPAGADALWIYNLHYFAYLWGVAPNDGEALIQDWMRTNRSLGCAAWRPYPISLRVREWIEWLLAHPELDADFRSEVVDSVATQVAVLARQLEFHLLGNHLLENAITLCWIGLSIDGAQADGWTALGVRILRAQLREQVLTDGTHEERSPMYQAILAENLLRLVDVAARIGRPPADEIRDVAEGAGRRLLQSLERLVHPDGEYALLNDSALGVAPSWASLRNRFGVARGRAPVRGAWALPAAGYAGYRAPGGYLVFDGGPIGPDHQPGHGHADTLSFELSHRGQRVITDTGVGTYAVGAMRQHDRSTAAHNTIQIDGRDQSELWGAFRCARRPAPRAIALRESAGALTVTGSYQGPGRGMRSVAHARRIVIGSSALDFTDDIAAAGERHSAALRLHVAPGLLLRRRSGLWAIQDEDGRAVALVAGDGVDWSESASPYHPAFGREESRPCLVATHEFRRRLTLNWRLILQ